MGVYTDAYSAVHNALSKFDSLFSLREILAKAAEVEQFVSENASLIKHHEDLKIAVEVQRGKLERLNNLLATTSDLKIQDTGKLADQILKNAQDAAADMLKAANREVEVANNNLSGILTKTHDATARLETLREEVITVLGKKQNILSEIDSLRRKVNG